MWHFLFQILFAVSANLIVYWSIVAYYCEFHSNRKGRGVSSSNRRGKRFTE